MGKKMQHRSRVAVDPTAPNLRQVHLMHSELFDELREQGYPVGAGQLGENITTSGVDLLALPTGAVLHMGASAVVRVTGLRNPCSQINGFEDGLLKCLVGVDPDGKVVRKAGIMGIVVVGGAVKPGDPIRIELPAAPHRQLERV